MLNENAVFEVSLKVLLKKGKKALLLKMPDDTTMAGYFDLIGGRIRANEVEQPFGNVINRELQEEIGNKVKYKLNENPVAIGRQRYFSKKEQRVKYIFWVLFEAVYTGGSISTSEEHSNYEWIAITKRNYKKYFINGPLEIMEHYLYGEFPIYNSLFWGR